MIMRDLVESIGPRGELEGVGYYFPRDRRSRANSTPRPPVHQGDQ